MTSLVIQLARFGDLVQTGRLLRTLFLRGQTHLCVDASLTGIAQHLYPEAVIHTLPLHSRDTAHFTALRQTVRALANISFDAVYNCNHAGVNRAIARLFAPEIQHGYRMCGPQSIRDTWVLRAFRWTGQRTIAPLNLVDYWAFFADMPIQPDAVNPPVQKQGQGRGPDNGLGKGLGVALAGREARRSLPPAVLGPIVGTAFEALGGVPVYLFGSAVEVPLARELRRHLPGTVLPYIHDLCGKTSLTDLPDALIGLDALICPDTGIMHLAARLGVPVRAFFLSSAWCHETGPYGTGHEVWQSLPACAPCLESAPCSQNTLCAHPFTSRALLRSIAHSFTMAKSHYALPEGMAHYTSYTDALGSAWRLTDGHDPYIQERSCLRSLIAECLGVRLDIPDTPNMLALTEMLYDEADWMLPPKEYLHANKLHII